MTTRAGDATTSALLTPPRLQDAAAQLRDRSPEEILAWTLEHFPGRTAVTVSFGGPGVALAYMAAQIQPSTPIEPRVSSCTTSIWNGRDGNEIQRARLDGGRQWRWRVRALGLVWVMTDSGCSYTIRQPPA